MSGLVSAPLGAIVGALTLHVADGAVFSEAWLTWWIADVVGILAFAPLVLAFKRDPEAPPGPLSSWRRLEAGLFVLTTALVVTVVFAVVPGRPVKFAVYPCLLWGALRFGLRGASGGLSLVSLLAVALTVHEWDAFVAADLPPLNGMHVVQLFLIATELSFLSLAAVIAERDQASRQLARLYDTVHRNRQQLEVVIETIPAMAWIALPDGTRIFANRHWREYTGLSTEATAGSGWQAAIHPEDIDTYLAKRGASLASGEQYEVETRIRRAVDGEYRWFLVRAVPLQGERGNVLQWYGIATDIEDRKRAEALLAGEKRILEMVARGASLAQILETLCRLVEEQIHDVLASVLLVEGNRLRHGAAPSLPESYTAAIDGMAIGPLAGSFGTAAYRAQRVIVSDIATDPLWAECREAALSHALRACWSTPIHSSEGRVIATFALYHRQPWSPTQRDQEIVEQITHLAGVAIQRKLGEDELRASEARFRTFVDHATDAFFLYDEHGTILDVNRQACESLGYSREELIGTSALAFDPDANQALVAIDQQLAGGEIVTFESRNRRKDGAVFPVETRVRRFVQGGHRFGVSLVRDITERKRAERRLLAQHTVTRILAEAETLEAAAPDILQAMCAALPWDRGALWRVDRQAGALRCVAVWSAGPVETDPSEPLDLGGHARARAGAPRPRLGGPGARLDSRCRPGPGFHARGPPQARRAPRGLWLSYRAGRRGPGGPGVLQP